MLVPSFRDIKRLSERISLYMEEASGRVSGELGESLKLDRHDVLVSGMEDGSFPIMGESCDIVAA